MSCLHKPSDAEPIACDQEVKGSGDALHGGVGGLGRHRRRGGNPGRGSARTPRLALNPLTPNRLPMLTFAPVVGALAYFEATLLPSIAVTAAWTAGANHRESSSRLGTEDRSLLRPRQWRTRLDHSATRTSLDGSPSDIRRARRRCRRGVVSSRDLQVNPAEVPGNPFVNLLSWGPHIRHRARRKKPIGALS
jgi:hypothetical protein